MKLDIISYFDLINHSTSAIQSLQVALFEKGIVGIKNVPDFENKTRAYINIARKFSLLPEHIKQQYAPNRNAGITEGYELGAEKFEKNGIWYVDTKKSSYYAFVPDNINNRWPCEVDLKTPYLSLGELIFTTGKFLLNIIGLNEKVGLNHHELVGYGRMLHYQKETDESNKNTDWCGAHYDHGVFTGLIPAYYFYNQIEVNEPKDTGLYIVPTNNNHFEKINSSDKSILLFQVGEFGQLLSNDRIKATKHKVKKVTREIERYSFALFFSASHNTTIKSTSCLIEDERYTKHVVPDKGISYKDWEKASYEQYHAK